MLKRRRFLQRSAQVALGAGFLGWQACTDTPPADTATETSTETEAPPREEHIYQNGLWFGISLAQWSLNKEFFSGELDPRSFAAIARNDYGIGAIEYVNQFFKDKAADVGYLRNLNQQAANQQVRQLLIMVDGEGSLGALDDAERKRAVENHYKWVDAARYLGCHSVRVNAAGQGSRADVAAAAADGLGRLSEYAQKTGLNVLVENHGGYSSDGKWLAGVMQQVGMDNCGTLPDFGNFCIERADDSCADEYDRYRGVQELMPYAKAVSAKTHDFNEAGDEIHSDYRRMLKLVRAAGYNGYIGIEYEGNNLDAPAGIRATKALLEKVGKEMM